MKRVKQFCLEAVMLLLSLVVLFPVLYAVVSSFKTRSEIGEPLSLPHLTLQKDSRNTSS